MYKVSAPGSLMLFGEHAVLHGHPALVAAVDKRITVELHPYDDGILSIKSELGEEAFSLNNLALDGKFSFILTCVDHYREQMEQGLALHIHTEFSSTIGFGSSAAVVVATLGAIAEWIPSVKQELHSPIAIAQKAKEIIQQVQGHGSGADAAAAALGGIVFFDPKKNNYENISFLPALSISYVGYKEKTAKVIELVKEKWLTKPALEQQIYTAMAAGVSNARDALIHKDITRLGELANNHHAFQKELGVSNDDLNNMCSLFNLHENIYGAKISGSGLGDCVIAFGDANVEIEGYKNISASLSLEGLRIEP